MTLSRLGGVRILGRDPLHRVPGCWYLKDSRMLHDLDDRTIEAMARESSMATYAEGEFFHEAGEPMSAVTFISRELASRRSVRMFSADPVPRELIEHAIMTAASSPSGATSSRGRSSR